MTDFEKLKGLLDEFGVEFSVERDEHDDVFVCCKEGSKKVSGFSLFYTDFEFDEQGKFVKMGAWK